MTQKVRAAGGVVLARRTTSNQLCALLIQQSNHKGWGFPKGKCDPGEEVRETALREVFEETGLVCTIVTDLEPTFYGFTTRKGKEVDKRVDWFLMTIERRDEPTHPEEILATELVPIPKLSDRLTYQSDRELLERSMPMIERIAAAVTVMPPPQQQHRKK